MRTFDPWVGEHYRSEPFNGRRLLILGESHYGGPGCEYAAFTSEVIRDMALTKGPLAIFSRIQRLVVGGRGGFSNEEREGFWSRVAFYNFIQSALEAPGSRPTDPMWQAGWEPFLQTLQELEPNIVLVLGSELHSHLPPIPVAISVCAVRHPSSVGFKYSDWQPKVLAAVNQP